LPNTSDLEEGTDWLGQCPICGVGVINTVGWPTICWNFAAHEKSRDPLHAQARKDDGLVVIKACKDA